MYVIKYPDFYFLCQELLTLQLTYQGTADLSLSVAQTVDNRGDVFSLRFIKIMQFIKFKRKNFLSKILITFIFCIYIILD
jgi:hypothetical protein